MEYVAATRKPFEPNVAHHFAFRGADDVTGVVSAVLAARTAKRLGVRHFVLQTMLNTPKATWGIQDLAKARATLQLVRELQDDRFRVVLQPRGGLDYFSPDLEKAKAQLAAVTALMDDIEPHGPASPPVINESVQITRHALDEYRRLRAKGLVDDMADHPDVAARTADLVSEARTVLESIEAAVPNPYTAEGLYRVFAAGFLPVPCLWQCRDEFPLAVRWPTGMVRGSVKVVDEGGTPVSARERMRRVAAVDDKPRRPRGA